MKKLLLSLCIIICNTTLPMTLIKNKIKSFSSIKNVYIKKKYNPYKKTRKKITSQYRKNIIENLGKTSVGVTFPWSSTIGLYKCIEVSEPLFSIPYYTPMIYFMVAFPFGIYYANNKYHDLQKTLKQLNILKKDPELFTEICKLENEVDHLKEKQKFLLKV